MRYVGGQKDNDLVTLVSESLSTGSRFPGPPIEQGEIVVGRHSVAQGEAFEFNIDLSKAPAPGSRRAARLAARAQQGLSQSLLHPDSPLGYLVRPFTENEEEAHAAAAAEAPVPEAPVEAAPVDALVDEELASVGATSTKKSRFSLFSRSRAAVVAVVAAASGIGGIAAGTLSVANENDAHRLDATAGVAQLAPVQEKAAKATFTVSVDGQKRTVTTTKPTLLGALADAGITVDGDDKVSQEMSAPVADGSTVTITRVEKKTVTEDVANAHKSSKVDDSSLAKGTTEVKTKGVDGVSANTYEVTYENGKETGRTLVVSSVKVARVDEVVSVGTKEAPPTKTVTTGDGGTAEVPSGGATPAPAGSSQQIAASMMGSYGWGGDQFSCLVKLWTKESNWNSHALNSYSGAYGIPQALPGSKMASAGADWQTNPATQIKWGLGYIKGRYGTPCGAWGHSQSTGWY